VVVRVDRIQPPTKTAATVEAEEVLDVRTSDSLPALQVREYLGRAMRAACRIHGPPLAIPRQAAAEVLEALAGHQPPAAAQEETAALARQAASPEPASPVRVVAPVMAELPQETLLEAAASGPQGQQTPAAVVAA
jgi:hypothetical protein